MFNGSLFYWFWCQTDRVKNLLLPACYVTVYNIFVLLLWILVCQLQHVYYYSSIDNKIFFFLKMIIYAASAANSYGLADYSQNLIILLTTTTKTLLLKFNNV